MSLVLWVLLVWAVVLVLGLMMVWLKVRRERREYRLQRQWLSLRFAAVNTAAGMALIPVFKRAVEVFGDFETQMRELETVLAQVVEPRVESLRL